MSQIFYFVLIIILCKKKGNFCSFFKTFFVKISSNKNWALNKKNLRQASLGKDKNDICNSQENIIVQKDNMKNLNVPLFTPYLSEEKYNFHSFHIIR